MTEPALSIQGTIQFRRGDAAEWTSVNPILAEGEMGIELDTKQFKIGDGTTAWADLSYGGLQGPPGTDTGSTSTTATVTQASQLTFAATYLAGSTPQNLNDKVGENVSLLDQNGTPFNTTSDQTTAFGIVDLLNATIRVPRGLHEFTATNSTGLRGHYTFEWGAMIQVAAGVVMNWAGASIEASPYQHIFDISAGGTHAGYLLNSDFSICWTGADATGNTPSGPAVQAAIDYKLCTTILAPDNVNGASYEMEGQQILQEGVHVVGPARAGGIYTIAKPRFNWTVDLGKTGDATYTESYYWRIPSYEEYVGQIKCQIANVELASTYDNTNKYITPIWNTDLLAIGRLGTIENGNSTLQVSIVNVTFTGGRMGSVNRTTNGHTQFINCIWQAGFAGAASVTTGGDYWYINCNAQSIQCAAFYHWLNTGWEQDLVVDTHRTGQTPYVFFQEANSHPDQALTAVAGISAGYLFKDMGTEALGNAFIWSQPGGYLTEGIWENVVHDLGWYGFGVGYTIQSMPYDYAIVVGNMFNTTMRWGKDGSGFGTFGPGNIGVMYAYGTLAVNCFGFVQRSTQVYVTAPDQQCLIIPSSYAAPQLLFQPAGTVQDGPATTVAGADNPYGGHSDGQTFDYPFTLEETASINRMDFIALTTSNGAPLSAIFQTWNQTVKNGVVIAPFLRVILTEPVTETVYTSLNLYGPGAGV
ncbi:hypothetical protein [Paraburkholderia sp. BCC1886]|uniref:hyaluronate lyase N-terminal domain-containing protein n=1 Tax=Paraburkholderia sp. BCC1886 TaxID=2562670 RepID=UPI0011838065|nr:hypothetical protein [Paraburkholderia sp. BCC1886]